LQLLADDDDECQLVSTQYSHVFVSAPSSSAIQHQLQRQAETLSIFSRTMCDALCVRAYGRHLYRATDALPAFLFMFCTRRRHAVPCFSLDLFLLLARCVSTYSEEESIMISV